MDSESEIEAEALVPKAKKSINHSHWKFYMFGVLQLVIMMGSFVLAYLIVDTTKPIPNQWIKVLSEKCPSLSENRQFHKAALADMGFSFLLPFSYIGVVLDSQYFGGSYGINSVHSFWIGLARLLVTVVTTVVLYLPSLLINSMDNLALLFTLRGALPGTVTGLYLFLGLKFLLQKMNLANRGEIWLRRKKN